jgi:hypothetical protein
MWESGKQTKRKTTDINNELLKMDGDLDDSEAKVSLAKFLRHNLRFTVELLTGIRLFAIQIVILRAWFLRNFNLAVWSRGGGKSFLVAIFCVLYCIFNKNSRVVIIAQNFRSSKRIFDAIDRLVKSPMGVFLQQCFNQKPSRKNDEYKYEINGGFILALPLGDGDKIRGTRGDVLIVDEFLLISEDIYKAVLLPFLVAKEGSDIKKQQTIKPIEDLLIKRGLMKEEERTTYAFTKKVILLSSASYQFEYLYQIYKKWVKIIRKEIGEDEKKDLVEDASYFVSQLAWDAFPPELMDKSIINEANEEGMSNAVFQREFGAQFTDDSDSYFSALKMAECTVPNCDEPTVRIVGRKDKEYILAIDPNASSSKNSDDFAMAVGEIVSKDRKIIANVHNYAKAGGTIQEHIEYLVYILTHFNIVYIIADKAGGETFIQAANNSIQFKEKGLQLGLLDTVFDEKDYQANPEDYIQALKAAKYSYNLGEKKIVHYKKFTAPQGTIRAMNEKLQAAFDYKKVLFGSKITAYPTAYEKAKKTKLTIVEGENGYESGLIDFIDEQEANIDLVKKECSLIEVRTSPTGEQVFDLPKSLRQSTSVNKARRDSYTCLLLMNWAFKCYTEIFSELTNQEDSFEPFGA